MSWREREFSHESDAYYRSLDQAWEAREPLSEAIMGYHTEEGKSILDWFYVTHEGKRVRVDLGYDDPAKVMVIVEGFTQYNVPRTDQLGLIKAARALAIKYLEEGNERPSRDGVGDHTDRWPRDSGSDLSSGLR